MKAAANDAEPKPERRRSSSPLRRDVQLHDRLEEAEAEVADLRCKLDASEARVKALEMYNTSLKANYNWLKERLDQTQSAKAQLEIAVSDQRQRGGRVTELEDELAGLRAYHEKFRERHSRFVYVASGWVEDFYRIRTRVELLQRGFRGWVLWLCRVDLSEIETLAMERRLPD